VSDLLGKAHVLLYDVRRLRLRAASEPCPACGARWPLLDLRVITPALAEEWDLDDRMRALFDTREGSLCTRCQGSARSRQLASAIVGLAARTWGTRASTLADLVLDPQFSALRIAEINSCGALHRFLRRLPNLAYSEFRSVSSQIPSEDLTDLSYATGSFDLVISSDTLEHVPEPWIALAEISRILRPGGWHVFTVPIVPDGRPTRRRAQVEGGSIKHAMPPSYHGRPGQVEPDLLVYHEFGMDLVDELPQFGFSTEVVQDSANPALITLISRKSPVA
jgi:SAM-dependent methyltransferase